MKSCRDNLLLGASCAGYIRPYNTRVEGFHYRSEETFESYKRSFGIIPFDDDGVIPYPMKKHMLDFDKPNLFYADLNDNICYRSMVDKDTDHSFSSYPATASTTIGWDPFIINGGAITGYQIFRKLGHSYKFSEIPTAPFDPNTLQKPHPLTLRLNSFENELEPIAILPSSARYFVDYHQNSRYAPVPGTVYHYEVRPIVDDIITRPSGSAPRIRVFTPPQNFALVHRWMANKTHCDLVAPGTELDPTNYSCNINTIQLSADGSEIQRSAKYDIGHDMLVMQVEAGCPYHRKGCTGGGRDDGACIGNGSPDDNNVEAEIGTVYYDRRSGKCYRKEDGFGVWALTDELTTLLKINLF